MLALLLPYLAVPKPVLMVHVMPWFSRPPMGKEWGWHWSMGKTNAAKGALASHYRPLIGAYDSADPDVIECQTLLMKIAGFDGMLVDWYGDRDRYDYLPNHHATQRLFAGAKQTGLSFALVYEDQTVPNLIAGGVYKKEEAVAEGKALFSRAERAWFHSPVYQKIGGKPLVMVFGPQFYSDADWPVIFEGLSPQPAFLTLHHRKGSAAGAYDWPLPQGGQAMEKVERFRKESTELPVAVPVAFPRFHDFYKEAGLHDSYGRIEDANGKTYERLLADAIAQRRPVVQVATWNDWGEGTQIEPSAEFGFRDLETTQRVRRQWIDPKFAFIPADLRLPVQLYRLRKRGVNRKPLDAAARALREGKTAVARKLLSSL